MIDDVDELRLSFRIVLCIFTILFFIYGIGCLVHDVWIPLVIWMLFVTILPTIKWGDILWE